MKLRTEIQNFKNIIAGQNVFIIAGGPSLDNFDFSKLKGNICIALNSAYKNIEQYLSAIFWTDNDWASAHYDKLMNFKGYKFQSHSSGGQYIKLNVKGFADSTVLHKIKDFGFTTDVNCVCGNNSGAQILNFVANLKPHKIILLGYDMGFSNGKTHWHGGYIVSDASVYNNLFIPSINSMAPFIEKLGIDVINCNLDSKLNCFRKDNLEKYL